MKHFILRAAIVLSALAASVGLCSVTTGSASAITLAFSGDVCSGTVVAPRVILTATHCFESSGIPNVRVNKDVVAIWKRVDDGNDHTLIEVSKVFKAYSPLGGALAQTDPVHIFGNPAGMPHVYRTGVVAAVVHAGAKVVYLFQMPTFFGDSGAGVFNATGQVTTAITGVDRVAHRGYSIQFAFAYPLAFTPADLQTVGMR